MTDPTRYLRGAPRSAPPPWLDRAAYPFEVHTMETPHGALRYVDEGAGRTILFVHGTPAWSFLWRRAIVALRDRYRCVAPDHLGFGLSDKPEDAPYRPRDHADRLQALVRRLELRDVTLVVHDFGGPIGLDWALRDLDRVERVVLMNTFLWPLADDPRVARASRLMATRFGRFLYRQLNLSPRVLLPAVYADRAALERGVHRHYLAPFPAARTREALWVLARELLASGERYADLWAQRERLVSLPLLILWGMRDPTFGPAYLARWEQAFPDARVVRLADVGHFVMEEAPDVAIAEIERFLEPGPRD